LDILLTYFTGSTANKEECAAESKTSSTTCNTCFDGNICKRVSELAGNWCTHSRYFKTTYGNNTFITMLKEWVNSSMKFHHRFTFFPKVLNGSAKSHKVVFGSIRSPS